MGITDGADNLATDPQFDPVFAAISQENARVNGLGKTVSIVYALPLPRKPSELSAELKGELEGAYLLQRRANDPTSDISGQPFIKLLVANVGERADGWQPVVTRIEQMLDPAQQGNVIGVAGLGQSFQTVQDAMRELARVRVPMVPARLTADNISPQPGRDGVFRIAPPNSKQVAAAATFLTNSCRPVLIQDIRQGDLYVDDLTSNFPQLTTAAGARSASCLAGASDLLPAARYDSSLPGVDTALQQRIPDICVRNPDTIYFGGRGSDLPAFIAALGSRDTRTCPGPITVVTADDGIGIAAEVARQNAPGAAPTLPNALRSGVKVVVTGIAHPGLWGPNPSPSNPALLALTGSCDRCLGPVFPGQTLDDGTVIMGHDAALVLVKGVRAGVNQQSQTVANTTVLQSLLGFGASRPVAGASGAIGFDATGAPIDKAVPLLTIDDRGAISLRRIVMTPRGTTPAMSPDGPGQQRFGHFVLVRKLGSGSMGEVWLARNTRRAGRAKHVAIKRIAEQMSQDSVFHERFRTEAAVVQICRDHPNIVRILDYSTVDDRLFLEMEYVEGTDLGAHLEEAGHLEPDEAVRIIEQAAAGLGEVHDRKIEHRDVKPANLLLRRVDRDTEPDDPRWRVVVTDFGIVSTGEGGLTLPNKFMGTPFYAAPEQWPQGPARGPVGAMDVYALGAVLYHLLAGQLPYPDDPADSRSPEESQFASRRAGSPPSPSTFRPDVAPAFDAVLSRAMAWQPQDRFRSTKEFAEAARAALEGRTAAAPASEEEVIQAGPVVPERRRLRVVLIGLAATLVLAAAAVAVGWGLLRPATLSASPLDLRVPTTGPVAVASGAAGPRAFVTANGQVLVVDLATRRIVGPLPGDGPGMALAGSITDLATSSDGASVYVSVDGSVIPYDAATLAHGSPTRLPDGAGHIAVAGSGADALLYVPSARTVGTVRPGAFSYGYTGSSAPPIAVAVDPSSQDTYVLSRAASGLQIERIDTAADRNAKPVGVPPEASGLAVTSDGTIWTATGDGLLAISTKDLTKRHLVPLPTTAGVRTLSAVGADLFVLTDDGRVILVHDDAVETSTSVVAPTVPGALAVGPEADCVVVVRPGSATVDIIDESSRCSG